MSDILSVDVAPTELTWISPRNADGVQDTLVVPFSVEMSDVVQAAGFRFEVTDAVGTVVYTVSGEASEAPKGIRKLFRKPQPVAVPSEFSWNGVDDAGSFVPDGKYGALVTVRDFDGVERSSEPVEVMVDNTPPSVEPVVGYRVFSPNGDGVLDELSIRNDSPTFEDRWTARIIGVAGEIVASESWAGVPSDFVWSGTDSAGRLLTEGTYRYVIAATDRAGNSFESSIDGIEIDVTPSGLSLHVSSASFSPNGDGEKDTLLFSPKLERKSDIVTWKLAVLDREGDEVRLFSGTGAVPEAVTFDGRDASGRTLPDGRYLGLLEVEYRNGDTPRAPSRLIDLDTTAPLALAAVPYAVFSPDGDGVKDVVPIIQTTSEEESWIGRIVASNGRVVKSLAWTGQAVDFEWDGLDDSGKIVPDGTYTYRLSSVDDAGNEALDETVRLRVDTRPTPVAVIPDARAFSPNGDGRFDTVSFALSADITDGIESWALEIRSASGGVVRRFAGMEEPFPPTVTWNGTGDGGAVASEGEYAASFLVTYLKGNRSTARAATPVRLDLSPPLLAVTVGSRVFTPDGDGRDDTVSIGLSASDSSGLGEWALRILDPYDREFASFTGTGAPIRQIVWDGRSSDGEMVQAATRYRAVFSAYDAVRNRGSASADIPVNIFVVSSGDSGELSFTISSIIFKPNTPDYLAAEAIGAEQVRRNLEILDQVAEVLRRYPGYSIRLEGHGVRVYWDDPMRWPAEERYELEPLTEARADAVRRALAERGVSFSRMSVEGLGGYRPVVPHGDLENRWKNRRVEFILEE